VEFKATGLPNIKGLGGPAVVLARDPLPARFVVRGDPAAFFPAVVPVLVDLVVDLPVANLEDVADLVVMMIFLVVIGEERVRHVRVEGVEFTQK